MTSKPRFDFGLSFANSEATAVGELYFELRNRGFSVFNYLEDPAFAAQTLGKNLRMALANTYERECRFCVSVR